MSSRNKTIQLSDSQMCSYLDNCRYLNSSYEIDDLVGNVIYQDFFNAVIHLPYNSVDLLIVDPPYNMTKQYGDNKFKKMSTADYFLWFRRFIEAVSPLLKPTASIYICSEWRTSQIIFECIEPKWNVRNRITWEREKGRGSKNNWKNSSEDIWYCTKDDKNFIFNVDDVKLMRRVIAPYKENGIPKDWEETNNGNFRMTHPSNLMNDLSVPFWSMPENTSHPTQKPEKLIAKLILASSNPGDVVFDPFCGSGTSLVTAKKLGRKFFGCEIEPDYCAVAKHRLMLAEENSRIQGYENGVFLERNTNIVT